MKKTIQDSMRLMTYQMRKLRINHHMTQKQMADILNVSAQSISAYENGVIRPDIEIIIYMGQSKTYFQRRRKHRCLWHIAEDLLG